MKPNDIYCLTPLRISRDLNDIGEIHIPEASVGYLRDSAISARVEIRHLVDEMYDSSRGAWMDSIWFEGKPVMITQTAGRGGNDFNKRVITNESLFWKLIQHIRTFAELDQNYLEVVDTHEDDPDLDYLYDEPLSKLLKKEQTK